ncbi:MAG: 4Fe-4S ferredoxin [Armatimonadetes bacterium CG_4_10_14_3_um_filter_66_18]|nr:4Fe-4S binding protein [Armatimonadota bacterium]PIU95413.1 MAG: 4Fe-4S ferredoxin [Armatimonadetes bacterium CG06_land_8_20_14_3_00_66_21]PIX43564.1 MAG: 4Fe-4S ferredoxin [Armatimonadetes bacterium CG_4_8_14_3_um_filter_66_20]PIY50388.1 MAG: 4Fe-4S ferredoxin [Armatimonadetes bacterium CG_4_10_14_3_um_filter_66_18]PIZ36600.1 MAG: 4Fe-4S ferredoxin [Armatimonadetes bacterium CG_4_10_14_0_8_um_filter_66_14]PJB75122.1 MAG: 4Fe-4S ferredoxin [Armatimonadetes bacterium CG_4_9_14_3_um_filter_66
MRRWLNVVRVAWAPLLLTSVAWAMERFPPPDFETAYRLPKTQVPLPRTLLQEYLDVALLALALSLAAYLVYKRRSRRELTLLSVFSVAYFGFWRKGCVCAIGSLQNVSLALADRAYHVPLTVVAFFALPLVFALFFGRTFCAAVCPHGALQDLVLVRPVKVPAWLERALSLLAHVYLGAAVLFAATGSAFVICRYDPFVGFFRLSGSYGMLATGAGLLLLAAFVGRPYCRFLCPYGVLLRMLSWISKWRVVIYKYRCTLCGICPEACPYGAVLEPTPPAGAAGSRQPRLALLGAQVVALMAVFGWVGSRVAVPLSASHPTVSLAERVYLEDAGKVKGTTDASANFRNSGQSSKELLDQAGVIAHQFASGGWLWGAWIGLALGGMLFAQSLPRERAEYEAERGACVACARCFEPCPGSRKAAADTETERPGPAAL